MDLISSTKLGYDSLFETDETGFCMSWWLIGSLIIAIIVAAILIWRDYKKEKFDITMPMPPGQEPVIYHNPGYGIREGAGIDSNDVIANKLTNLNAFQQRDEIRKSVLGIDDEPTDAIDNYQSKVLENFSDIISDVNDTNDPERGQVYNSVRDLNGVSPSRLQPTDNINDRYAARSIDARSTSHDSYFDDNYK